MTERKMQRSRGALALVALLALSACLDAPGAQLASAPDAGPVAKSTDPQLAGQLFGNVCLRSFPSFDAAPAAMAQAGFVQNSTTGTFYLPGENLSIKLLDNNAAPPGTIVLGVPSNPNTCSLVFGTNVPVDAAVDALARGTASTGARVPPNISVTSRASVADRRLFNLRISAP